MLMVMFPLKIVSSISCYKCLSINGSNPSCEDSFQGDVANEPSFLQAPCLTHLRGRAGLFPATHCIKLVAYSKAPKPTQYMYRTCGRDEANDNGIAHSSHCGFVKLHWLQKNQHFRGCLHTCDSDACNRTSYSSYSFLNIFYCFSIFILVFFGE
ncbi:unnamed protein product [Rotaria socialis]|nr:unnamed protein product [Rotaria socialis]CAF3372553.1 unnamed protein product [Rotaria socialis]CAF3408065.1 unnamed protein product [Rotaria socialis]CAF4183099.1 unnamed protein product [Rotaria socialis]CAF4381096.1 unnamed protein product [Rotaria socialis]